MSCFKALSVLSVSAAVLLSACGGPTPTIISGTLLGHDGEPMVAAGVRVSRWSTRNESDSADPGAVFQVVEDGRFEIQTFETGLLALRFVGAYHEAHVIPLYADTAVSLYVDVQLGTFEYPEDFESDEVLGSFDEYDPSKAVDMDRQPDGRFLAVIETADSVVTYVLRKPNPGDVYSFYGTDSDEFIYGKRSRYASVARTDDLVEIEEQLALEHEPVLKQALLLNLLFIQFNDGTVSPPP